MTQAIEPTSATTGDGAEPTPGQTPPLPTPGSPTRRVLLVAYTFPPATSVGVFRVLRFVKYLAEFGWQSQVLTVDPAVRGDRTDPGLLAQVPESVSVLRTSAVRPEERLKQWIPLLRPSQKAIRQAKAATGVDEGEPLAYRTGSIPITWRRRIGDLAFSTPDDKVGWIWAGWHPALSAIRRERPDVIVATGPPFTAHLFAALLSRRTGVPLVLDFRDPWARCPWGPRKDIPFSQRMLERLEAWCVRRAAAVVLNTERLCDEFRQFYGDQPAEKFTTISNGYDPDLARQVQDLPPRPAAEGAGLPPALLHPGSLYGHRDPRPVVEALALLAQRGRRVRLVQYGPCDPAFRAPQRAAELGIADLVELHAAVPHGQLLERMQAADALLLVQPGTSLQIPGKLFEMLLFDKPIVTLADEGATADLVQGYKLGGVARPDRAEQIASAIEQALFPAEPTGPGASRTEALAAFDGRRLTQALAEVLERALRRA